MCRTFGRSVNTIEEAIEAIAAGKAVIVMDDEDRENEGDIIFAAQYATSELMGWTIRYSSGVICIPMIRERAEKLALPPMVAHNEDPKGTAYTVSCDAAHGITTGISANDRALGARVLSDKKTTPADLTRPGHLFPLIAHDSLLQGREGHTEAAITLCSLAHLEPVGVLVELVAEDGNMLRGQDVIDFAHKNNCPVITIEELKKYPHEKK
ncbi:MAG: 3,4-dihydroxy-2-butanone-4-phosphate synthase [Micrococcaceae bacterium]